MLHERENNQESEIFLKENGEKFQGDCLIVMKLLYSGLRLTARTLEKTYDIDGRRLRDCYAARPDIIKKEKIKDETSGRSKFVEYYIEVPHEQTKKVCQEFWNEFTKSDGEPSFSKPTNNPYPLKSFTQMNLF